LPVTPMTTKWYEEATGMGRWLPVGDPRIKQIARWTTTDDNGQFECAGLAAGDYYLVSQLTPGVHTGYAMLKAGSFSTITWGSVPAKCRK
jgi:hypothetical protein